MFPRRGEGTSSTVKSEVTLGFSPPHTPPAQIPTRQRHLHFLFRSTRRVLLLYCLYRVVISCKLRIASSVYAPTLAPTQLSTTLLELTDLYAHLATGSNLAQFSPQPRPPSWPRRPSPPSHRRPQIPTRGLRRRHSTPTIVRSPSPRIRATTIR